MEFPSHPMRTRVITIILVGIIIGFLLALGIVAFLRALIDGDNPGLSIAFTVFVVFLAALFIWYVVRTTPGMDG